MKPNEIITAVRFCLFIFYLVSQNRISLDSGAISLDKHRSLQGIHFLKIISFSNSRLRSVQELLMKLGSRAELGTGHVGPSFVGVHLQFWALTNSDTQFGGCTCPFLVLLSCKRVKRTKDYWSSNSSKYGPCRVVFEISCCNCTKMYACSLEDC